MKFIVVLLSVLSIFTSTRGNGGNVLAESGGHEVESSHIERPADYKIFFNMAADCFVHHKEEILMAIRHLDTSISERARMVVAEYCDREALDKCLIQARSMATTYFQDVQKIDKVNLQYKLFRLVVKESCAQNGTRLDSYVRRLLNFDHERVLFMITSRCVRYTKQIMPAEANNGAHFSLQQYQVLTIFKECLADHSQLHEIGFNGVISILNDITDKLTCIEEQTGTKVLCNMIVQPTRASVQETPQVKYLSSSVSAGSEYQDSIDSPVAMIFFNIITNCVLPTELWNIDITQSDSLVTGQIRRVVKNYCEKVQIRDECIHESQDLAEAYFLDPVRIAKVRNEAKLVQLLLRVACEQNGTRLESVFEEYVKRPGSLELLIGPCANQI